jgi:isopentenyl diphosphate isomerase/L-lactate dehydrogenase-like FMN-dependent dehydrogenase
MSETVTQAVSTRVDMSTTYLGMKLCSPIVASASPMTGDPARWELL